MMSLGVISMILFFIGVFPLDEELYLVFEFVHILVFLVSVYYLVHVVAFILVLNFLKRRWDWFDRSEPQSVVYEW